MTSEHPDHLAYKKPGDFGDLETLRHQAESLQPLELTVDIDRLSAFVPVGKVEIGAISEQLGPGSGEGLQVSADLGKLDEGLRRLREQEASAKLRRLLEQAQQKIAEKRFQSAIVLLDQALNIDRTSALALLLKGSCHFELGDFDGALELFAKARQYASDPETAILVLALRAACERDAMRQFEDELAELLENGRPDEALERVNQRLHRQPANATLLYALCTLLLSTDRLPAAKAAAERALNVVSEANAPHFHNLLRHIAVQESHGALESARLSLRQGDARSAIAQLGACSTALSGDERFEALRSYAYERHVGNARLKLVWRARMRQGEVRSLDSTALQRLLCWLVEEELQAGVEALNAERFDTAKEYFAAAGKIDSRGSIVAFLHAVALFRDLQQAFKRKEPPALGKAYADLRFAAQLAAQALPDPAVGDQVKNLVAAIDQNLRVLDDIRAQAEKARRVSECVSRFNTLVTHYERKPITSMAELTAARRIFRQLANDVNGLRSEHTPNSSEGQALGQLIQAIHRIEKQLVV